MIDLGTLNELVHDTLEGSKDCVQIEEVIRELAVRGLAGDLDVNELTEDSLRRRICRMVRSFRLSSMPLTVAEFKAAPTSRDEDDPEMLRLWELVRDAFSLDGRGRMLVPARRGDIDQGHSPM